MVFGGFYFGGWGSLYHNDIHGKMVTNVTDRCRTIVGPLIFGPPGPNILGYVDRGSVYTRRFGPGGHTILG